MHLYTHLLYFWQRPASRVSPQILKTCSQEDEEHEEHGAMDRDHGSEDVDHEGYQAAWIQALASWIQAGNDVNATTATIFPQCSAEEAQAELDCGYPALWSCCEMDDEEAVRMLVAANADLGLVDSRGIPPLSACCMYEGSPACTRLMLEAKAAVNQESRTKATPLMVAAHDGNAECLQILLAAGASVNPNPNPTNPTPRTQHPNPNPNPHQVQASTISRWMGTRRCTTAAPTAFRSVSRFSWLTGPTPTYLLRMVSRR